MKSIIALTIAALAATVSTASAGNIREVFNQNSQVQTMQIYEGARPITLHNPELVANCMQYAKSYDAKRMCGKSGGKLVKKDSCTVVDARGTDGHNLIYGYKSFDKASMTVTLSCGGAVISLLR